MELTSLYVGTTSNPNLRPATLDMTCADVVSSSENMCALGWCFVWLSIASSQIPHPDPP